ncbi:Uncharacterised protein [Legionella pneumophila]|uniref:Uncharacterized protein n=1 Tax=Legionella pneumophila TaxID=446 RepID=A0A128R876_LEGPN|nr:hypothetical protein ULM_05410 [Legionella pneumophila]MDC7847393.1 hypothetical protein [Legionella pneumophila]WBA01607.1 hypothetical protein LpnA194_00473 [Legionella pneumophila]WBA04726.1 hypothetical protein LpnH3D14_00521 [Legionella pneumophila]CZG06759.1 Uncharacterised protein [Legionella pneumophila]
MFLTKKLGVFLSPEKIKLEGNPLECYKSSSPQIFKLLALAKSIIA